MKIRLAESAGFCMGVMRAARTVDELTQDNAVTFGPLIHNPQMTCRLEERGVGVIDSVEQAAGKTVVIRSHGLPPDVKRRLIETADAVIDTTCAYIQRIYKIVSQASDDGLPCILIGEPEHPEVVGIAGYAKKHYIIEDADQVKGLPEISEAVVVAQTTLESAVYENAVRALKERIPKLTAHNTICDATSKRQREAVRIAQAVDAMIVVGGRNSSNTRRLYELCKAHCPTHLIETKQDLKREMFGFANTIGVTAGASTPDWILKEVLTEMTDMEKMDAPQEESNEISMQDSFQEALEKTLVTIRSGNTVKGVVVQVTDEEVCVNIGYKSDGIVPRNELLKEGDPRVNYPVGDEIEVEVVKVNDGEGNVLLSEKNIIAKRNWDVLVGMNDNKETVEGVGKEVVKGGLLADVMGVRAFIPASQLSDRYVEKMDEFIGQNLRLRIIEMDPRKRRLVASRKQVLLEEREALREKLWETLAEGATVKGIVRRLTDFGAFVDVGGLDGLVHVTDLSWGRVKHPSDVVSIGEEIDVLVLAIDKEKERVSLGVKQLTARPWDTATQRYPVGDIITGDVVRIVPFGAFIELEPGLDGLVHISQISDERVNKVEDKLKIGDKVTVKIIEVNPETKRISLSIREAMAPAEAETEADEPAAE